MNEPIKWKAYSVGDRCWPLVLRRLSEEEALQTIATLVASACISDWDDGRLGPVASVALSQACRDYVSKRANIEALTVEIEAAT